MLSRGRMLVIALALTLLAGCQRPVIAPVKGRVACDGKPVVDAYLIFDPVAKDDADREPGKPATGKTNAAGEYVLSTYKPYDGALVGSHTVTVSLDDSNPAKCKKSRKLT